MLVFPQSIFQEPERSHYTPLERPRCSQNISSTRWSGEGRNGKAIRAAKVENVGNGLARRRERDSSSDRKGGV